MPADTFGPIKNLIFDLGNVVIDISPSLTYEAFAMLSTSKNAKEIEETIKEKNLWLGYEEGLFDENLFRQILRENLDLVASDNEIDNAFNRLLLDVDSSRIDRIEELGKKYRTFVLSNTSKIHMIEFEKIVERCTGRTNFWGIFEKPYLSYEMQKLKPNLDIYQQVLAESNLVPEQTLFIDDLKANVAAANSLNINIVHLEKPNTILTHPLLSGL